jgi:RNA polymerase sigma-B factor
MTLNDAAARPPSMTAIPSDVRLAERCEAWLAQDAATRDPALRDQIILANLGVAERIANRFHDSRTVSRDDLRQMARTGLVAAVNRYDPERGVPFLPYAIACVVGEIKRGLRDTTWRLNVSHRVKELTVRLLAERDRLTVSLGCSPTLAELAVSLRTSQEAIAEALEAASTRAVLSLDHPVAHDSAVELGDTIPAEPPHEELEDLLLLPRLIDRLPEIERRIVVLYFFEDLRQRDIGDLLGCSQMQISRLLAKAVNRLRASLLVP